MTVVPVVVLPAAVATDEPDDASVVSPTVSTVTVSPAVLPGAHVFTNVNVALLRIFVSVHTIAESDGSIVKVAPLNGIVFPVHANDET